MSNDVKDNRIDETIVQVPEPKIFFRKNFQERLTILKPLYLYTLIEYLELLDDYRQKNPMNDCLKQIDNVDDNNGKSLDNDDNNQTFQEKIQNVFDHQQLNNNNDNNHSYRKHLIENVHFDNDEQIDQLMEMIDERLERIQLMAILHDQNGNQQQPQPQQQHFSSVQRPSKHQQQQQKIFKNEVIDLTTYQHNDNEDEPKSLNNSKPSSSSFVQLDGHILPLPEEFCQMEINQQNRLLESLPKEIRQKYSRLCSKHLSYVFLQFFSKFLKEF